MKIDRDKLIKIIDFWQKSLKSGKLHDREIISQLDVKSNEIIDIIGPRRSGKSSLLKLIITQQALKDNFLYINFEDPFFIDNNEPEILEHLIDIYQEYFTPHLDYLFLDEIQQIKNWEKIVRKLRDGTNYKIFITGSSSTLLSRELSSLLTGRHVSHTVLPLSFREFLSFKGVTIHSKKDIVLKESLITKRFDDFVEIGGFPEVVLRANTELLKSYFYDFLQKDIIVRHDIRDKEALEKMTVFLMSNVGKTVSYVSMEKTFDLAYASVKSYMSYLRDAFLIFEVGQFSFSLKKQSKALKKIYAVDTGLARAASFRFSADNGRILENIVFLELLRTFDEIFYYRTHSNREVDFLVRESDHNVALIQVCWSMEDEKTRKREIGALEEAMEELQIKKAYVITHAQEEKIISTGKTIMLVPAWKWLVDKHKQHF